MLTSRNCQKSANCKSGIEPEIPLRCQFFYLRAVVMTSKAVPIYEEMPTELMDRDKSSYIPR